MSTRPAGANPLAQMAEGAPAWFGDALSYGGRLAGAVAALTLVASESYDRTQVFAAAVAALAGASCPLDRAHRGIAGPMRGLAAGLLFFSGTMLWSEPAGVLMTVLGAVAGAGMLISQHREGRDVAAPVVAFFLGLGLSMLCLVAVALAVEG